MDTQLLFGVRLKELRKNKGLTQIQLAEKVGVNQSTFANWESGRRVPLFRTVIELAKLLGASLDYLFGLDDGSAKDGTSSIVNKLREKEWEFRELERNVSRVEELLEEILDQNRELQQQVLNLEKLK